MSISERLKQFHDNYLSAKEMVTSAEGSPSKTIKFLPSFRRVYPQGNLDWFSEIKKSQQQSLEGNYCATLCKDNECLDACKTYYKNAMAEGLEFIRKVQKQYKLATSEDDE